MRQAWSRPWMAVIVAALACGAAWADAGTEEQPVLLQGFVLGGNAARPAPAPQAGGRSVLDPYTLSLKDRRQEPPVRHHEVSAGWRRSDKGEGGGPVAAGWICRGTDGNRNLFGGEAGLGDDDKLRTYKVHAGLGLGGADGDVMAFAASTSRDLRLGEESVTSAGVFFDGFEFPAVMPGERGVVNLSVLTGLKHVRYEAGGSRLGWRLLAFNGEYGVPFDAGFLTVRPTIGGAADLASFGGARFQSDSRAYGGLRLDRGRLRIFLDAGVRHAFDTRRDPDPTVREVTAGLAVRH